MDMFYFSLSPEVEARVQEVAAQLKKDKSKSTNDTIMFLMQFEPVNDAKKMLNYSTEDVLKIDDNVLKDFMDIFNKNLHKVGLQKKIKKDKNYFFEYWRKTIIKSGGNLMRKINRMISDKHHFDEINMDIDLLKEIYGIN